MNTLWHWLYPGLFGIVCYYFIRLITDIPSGRFTDDSGIGLLVTLFISYTFYLVCRFYFSKRWTVSSGFKAIIREYSIVVCFLVVLLNTLLLFLHIVGIVVLGDVIHSLVIDNFVAIPMLLLYYMMVRNQEINRYYRQQATLLEKVKSDQLHSELNFLKAQYHPHFLFNALNTIYFQISADNKVAKESVELLSGLLRYQLYDIQQKVSIEKEIEYLRSYIQFQQLRTSERLKLELYIDPTLQGVEIHPLLFQPLVENAFKYIGGDYEMVIRLTGKRDEINFFIRNSVSDRRNKPHDSSGIGLSNLKRRLELLYPYKYSFKTEKFPTFFEAGLIIEV